MSFPAYLKAIEPKTGLAIPALMQRAEAKGFVAQGKVKPTVKAGEIIPWLKDEFDLGRGHAMAFVAYGKGKRT